MGLKWYDTLNDPQRSCQCFRRERERPTDRVGERGFLLKPQRRALFC